MNFNKEVPSRSKHTKKAVKRNVDAVEGLLIRRKRDPDDLIEENSNFDIQSGLFFNLLTFICKFSGINLYYSFLQMVGGVMETACPSRSWQPT